MTSTEWLDEQIQEYVIAADHVANTMVIQISFEEYMDLKRQAKEMHKQEIIDAIENGNYGNGNEYYQETFVSKGSYINGDIVTKDSVIVEFPQQEISDEEIDKAKENAWSDYEYQEGNLYSTTFRDGWLMAIKWYREQLKQL